MRDEKLADFPRTPEETRRHIAEYFGMISDMDEKIGDILAALARKGLADDTIVVYTADHGLSVGQHGLLGKQNLYDHSVRVPLIVRGPGVPSGKRVDALTHTYDVYPTLCDLAGLEVPTGGRCVKSCASDGGHCRGYQAIRAFGLQACSADDAGSGVEADHLPP